MQIIVEAGGTYTLQTSPTGLPDTWVDEFTDADYTPISASPVAEFGIAIFLENSDKGEFVLTIDNFTEIPIEASVELIDNVDDAGSISDGETYAGRVIPAIDPAVDGSDPLLVVVGILGYSGFGRGITSIEIDGVEMNLDASSGVATGGPPVAIGSLPGKQFSGSTVSVTFRGNMAVVGLHFEMYWVKGLERDGIALPHVVVDSEGAAVGGGSSTYQISLTNIKKAMLGVVAFSNGTSVPTFTNWTDIDIGPDLDSWFLNSTLDTRSHTAGYVVSAPTGAFTTTANLSGDAARSKAAVSWE